jgi:hypothetical protein
MSEAVKQHFNELKECIVSPVIWYLQNAGYHLPTSEDAKKYYTSFNATYSKNHSVPPEFDQVLIDDFLGSHYPEVKELWDEVCKSNERLSDKRTSVNKIIMKKIGAFLKQKKYKKYVDSTRYHNLYVSELESMVESCMINDDCDSSKIVEDENEPGRILLNQRIIYLINLDENIEKVIKELRILFKSIISDREIIKEVRGKNGSRELAETYKNLKDRLYNVMNTIYRHTHLQIIKDNQGKPICQFMN